jgi:hypothetical protein
VTEHSRCPRCGGTFRCGAADRVPCACTTVRLDDRTRAFLRDRFVGCLCLDCLRSLGEPVVRTQTPPPGPLAE